MSKIKNEPAVITSVLVALIGAAATLGLIGTDTQDQLVAVITAVAPIIGGLVIRANVTPNGKVAKASAGKVYVDVVPRLQKDATVALEPAEPAPAEPQQAEEQPAPETAADPAPAPAPEPAPEPVEADPVKAQLKAAIEQVRANSNATNDARAAAAKAAVDASA